MEKFISKKEQEKVMARDLTKIHISNIPGGKFKVTIIRILAGVEKRMEDIREDITTEIKEF